MGTGKATWSPLVLAILLTISVPSRSAEGLTASDFTWLAANLDLAADSPAILELSEAQRGRLHELIARAKAGSNRERQDVVNFLTGAVGQSIESTLDSAGQPVQPRAVGAPSSSDHGS